MHKLITLAILVVGLPVGAGDKVDGRGNGEKQ